MVCSSSDCPTVLFIILQQNAPPLSPCTPYSCTPCIGLEVWMLYLLHAVCLWERSKQSLRSGRRIALMWRRSNLYIHTRPSKSHCICYTPSFRRSLCSTPHR